jgi:hypothetical protein
MSKALPKGRRGCVIAAYSLPVTREDISGDFFIWENVMGRKTIKMDYAREAYENGALLERDERFEDDAEWHGRLLDNIDTNLNDLLREMQANMPDALRAIDTIAEQLQQLVDRPLQQAPQDIKPVSTMRFIVNWIIVVFLVLLFKAT